MRIHASLYLKRTPIVLAAALLICGVLSLPVPPPAAGIPPASITVGYPSMKAAGGAPPVKAAPAAKAAGKTVMTSFTFNTLPTPVEVTMYCKIITPVGTEGEFPFRIGESGKPFTFAVTEENGKFRMTFDTVDRKNESFLLADPDHMDFRLEKWGYLSRGRGVKKQNGTNDTICYSLKELMGGGSNKVPYQLYEETKDLVFFTDPPGARVFVYLVSAVSMEFLGKTDKVLSVKKTLFPDEQQSLRFIFQQDFFKDYPKEIALRDFSEKDIPQGFKPSKAIESQRAQGVPLYYYKAKITLIPDIPVISHLKFWAKYHPFYFYSTSILSLIIIVLIISYLKKHISAFIAERLRVAAWEALATKVNRDDPLFGRDIGKYRVVNKLGSGGMAVVYRAVPVKNLKEEDSVAIKVMHQDIMEDKESLDRFKREMKISSALNHANILKILDFGDQEVEIEGQKRSLLFIVMDLLKGKSLRAVIPPEGLPVEKFMEIITPVMKGVQHAHERGIIHRDLKPENIMLCDDGKVVVMDFGLARRKDGTNITQSGTTLGTPAYMSPEQVTSKEVDGRSDQYSIGIMAFHMLTGQLPFYDDVTINILFKHVTDAPPPLRSLKPDYPESFEKILLRMMEKEPDKRFKSVKEALEHFEFAASDYLSKMKTREMRLEN
ncbi:MAG: serine/threonine-protein kinase [Candidatus Eremiobacteraeota bacterium]|nr:serine/threonine-protein kinase [Candidatus Eremiobacteraeota bacterium]